MPLQFASHPNNAADLISTALERLTSIVHYDPSAFAVKKADLKSLKVDTPHTVYELTLDSLIANRGIETATNSGTRYLIQCSNLAVAAIELWRGTNPGAPDQHRLGEIHVGPHVGSTAKALLDVAADLRVINGHYEMRVLRCAPIHLMAVWLKNHGAGGDLFVPLAPAPGDMKAGQFYDAESLRAEARKEAHVRLEAK